MAQAVRRMGALAAASLLTAAAAPAAGQVTPGSQQGLGLTGADIPPLLKQVAADPYRAPAEPACETIPQEILTLDKVLGPDVDGPKVKTGIGHMAVNYVRHAIPYRGWVRFLTRADSKDKALQAAATAGFARRGFLRGLEASLHCSAPVETAAAQVAVTGAIPRPVVADNGGPPPAPDGERQVKLMLVATPAEHPGAAAGQVPDQDAQKPAPEPAAPSGR